MQAPPGAFLEHSIHIRSLSRMLLTEWTKFFYFCLQSVLSLRGNNAFQLELSRES